MLLFTSPLEKIRKWWKGSVFILVCWILTVWTLLFSIFICLFLPVFLSQFLSLILSLFLIPFSAHLFITPSIPFSLPVSSSYGELENISYRIYSLSIMMNCLSSVQFSSVTQLCPTLCNPMNRSTPGLPVHHQLPEFTQTHVHWVGDAIQPVMPSSPLILSRPLLLLPPISPSIRVFSNELTLCMRWTKYWSFSFSISPSNEHPGLISFRMDRLDLLAVQGTLTNLLQHHSWRASVLQHSAFSL